MVPTALTPTGGRRRSSRPDLRPAGLVLSLLVLSGCTPEDAPDAMQEATLRMTVAATGTDALLQAISPVTDSLAWVSGHGATYAVTTDGGWTWDVHTVPEAAGLQFRDVAAFSRDRAYLMTAGSGEQSRIYGTGDGGRSWALQYVAGHPDAFLDCMDFWSPERGLVYGDAVDGIPFVLTTSTGGATWTRVPAERLPPALDGEGGFAASGTCLVTGAGGRAWIATGNAERARILRTHDYGETWEAVDVPVVAGSAAGLATVAVAPDGRGVALGGVIGEDSIRSENVAVTEDEGATWSLGGPLVMDGPVYGSALVPGRDGYVVAVGPRGLDLSTDGGSSWRSVDATTWWAVAFASDAVGWAAGPGGRIARLTLEER